MGRKVVHASLFAGENKWGSQIEISLKTYKLEKNRVNTMKRFACLFACLMFLGPIIANEDRSKPDPDAKPTEPLRAPPRIIQPRHTQTHSRSGQPYLRPTRWEYSIMEVRIKGPEQGESFFQLHMPARSSGRTRDIAKAFREVHVQMTKTSRIDEINALNTLGTLGWELVFSQKKEATAGNSVFYYFKRRI